PAGQLKLINLVSSYENQPIDQSLFKLFIEDCLSIGDNSTIQKALSNFGAVSSKYSCLCKIKSPAFSTMTLVNVIISEQMPSLIKYPESDLLKRYPDSEHPTHIAEYNETLRRITSKPNWWVDDAFVGGSFPTSLAWIAQIEEIESEIRKDMRTVNSATKLRDILGLIHFPKGTYLLSIKMPVKCIVKLDSKIIARPSFADNGNARFAVYLGKYVDSVYSDDWGVTVNLWKSRSKPLNHINGVAERIGYAIPYKDIKEGPLVDPIGFITENRGREPGIDDDDVFVNHLLFGKSLIQIKEQILNLAG
ncbi:hypothetical protein ACFLUS_04530, partial [Chloroflexota bacterium]